MPKGVYKRTKWHRQIISKGRIGIKFSKDHKEKISIALKRRKGKIKFSKQACLNMSNSHKGKKFTKKRCKNISKKILEGYKIGKYKSWNKGLTAKTDKRIASSRKKYIKTMKGCNYEWAAKVFLTRITKNNIKNWGFGNNSWFYSKKNKKKFRCLSDLERQHLQFLELNDNVIRYQTNPLRILYKYQGKQRNYIPDVLVDYNDGKQILIEVKQKRSLKDKQVQAKAMAARKYCKENDMEFRIWTEEGFLN